MYYNSYSVEIACYVIKLINPKIIISYSSLDSVVRMHTYKPHACISIPRYEFAARNSEVEDREIRRGWSREGWWRGGGEKDGGKLNERAREPHSALGNKKLTNLIWVYEITHFNDSRRREYHGILVISGGGGGGGEKRTRVLRLHRTRQRAFQFERPILARIRFAVSADAV